MRSTILPLGVDLGSTRARVAVAERFADGAIRVCAVASRDLPVIESAPERTQLIAILLEEMLSELRVRERRCVAAVGSPHALLRIVRFPKMSWAERLRAAHYEAQRSCPWEFDPRTTTVRVYPRDGTSGVYAVGLVRTGTILQITEALRAVRMRAIAIDYDALALRRAIPHCHAIIDIGANRSTLHAYQDGVPVSVPVQGGGATVTRGIVDELGIDEPSAERRKRILGCAGVGMHARDHLIIGLKEAVEAARARAEISRIALVGNGARLPGLAAGLECATGALIEVPVPLLLETDAYPDDVLRAAAPDWTLAAALATWQSAA